MNSNRTNFSFPSKGYFTNTHYGLLNLHPSASPIDIRRAYRELSKLYHPDTTNLPLEEAKQKFQRLNEAYGTLANPERRSLYDLKIGYSRWNVIQSPYDFTLSSPEQEDGMKSSYLDPTERPLSSGELFALLLMGITIFSCMLLAITIAWLRTSAI
ncbi:J domain-containing protein [Geminocystis sp. NIES-3709]|uniref:J domain-containing protein n=1 Tax=Geminocystis sp. NIES-3709 TaxID=1617448 RepID=UPI0005FCC982|nr:J domain-containing protein [Geminocystis sp. NIES-3709]BAQ63658.1 DnaJ-class molecular chaperone CbpA [Geminocystis sp. NIES-3709]